MLKSKAKWTFLNIHEEDEDSHSSSIIDNLLQQRGILSTKEKKLFFHPTIDTVESAEYLNDIERAKERVLEALQNNEKVVVYGDYDADGVTATTVMVKTLRQMGVDCDFYIPNRFAEGFGLSIQAIEHFALANVSLIITVDTGITNVEEVNTANDLGIDVIITDHHEIQEDVPNAYAIIHPHLSQNYSYKHLSGAGIAFQFASYLLEERPMHLIDLVAIGTVADLVPLTGENRAIVYEGIKRLNKTENIGIKKLIKYAKINSPIDEKGIGFGLGPRINAVGRLEDATLAVELLLTNDEGEAEQIAAEIEQLNTERQQIVQAIVEEAKTLINDDDYFIVLANESWHEGVLGIAASRIVNLYHRPVMLLTINEKTNEWKGSARSIPRYNLFENGIKIKHLFSKFGGHSQAAGMSIPLENLAAIKHYLNESVKAIIPDRNFQKDLFINQSVELEAISEHLVTQINQFSPFGMDNEEPLFHIEAVPVEIRQLGADKQHLKLKFNTEKDVIEAIGFQFGHVAPFISQHSTVSLVGYLQINEWNGNKTVQLNIQDIAVHEWQLFDYRGKQHFSYLDPYLRYYHKNILVCNDLEDVQSLRVFENLQIITYESNVDYLHKTEVLYIYDLPKNLDTLITILQKTSPESVFVSYQVSENSSFQTIPNREEFKWVYGYIMKNEPLHLKVDYPRLIKMNRLSKDKINFILKVFLDLQFIEVNNNIITINKEAKKADLSESITYKYEQAKNEIESILYYSTYNELKEWLKQHVSSVTEEEIVHEL